MENESNNENNNNNGDHQHGNNDIINIININNNIDRYYNNDAHRDENHEAVNDDSVVIPLALRSEMLRMLYELRIPMYAYGAMGGGGGGAVAIDDMEQAAAAILARSLYDSRPVKHVIDIADDETGEKHGIRTITYTSETAKEMKINTACGIWQEEFEEGEEIKLLPCNHAFRAEAITKWLTTEKAECPICRFKMDSKEVIVHSDEAHQDIHDEDEDDENDEDDNDDDDDDDNNFQNSQRARENNIMNRQNNIIYNRSHAGGAADMLRGLQYEISMPMNSLLQMRRSLINGSRASGSASGSASGGSISNPEYLTNAARAASSSQNIQPPPIITNINNYNNYYINQYHISAEEQEQADIEEAIRRSLQ